MKDAINCLQPFLVYTMVGPIAIAHNGELVDAQQQRKIVNYFSSPKLFLLCSKKLEL